MRAFRPAPLAALVLAATLPAAVVACDRADRPAGDPNGALDRDVTLAADAARPPIRDSFALDGDTAAVPGASSSDAGRAADAPAPAPERAPGGGSRVARAEPPPPPAAGRRSPAPRPEPVPPRAPAREPVPAVTAEAPPPPSVNRPAAPRPTNDSAGSGNAAGSRPARFIPAGALLAGVTRAPVCSETNRPGDRLVVNLESAVAGANGAALAAGTPMVIELVEMRADPASAEFVMRGVSVGGDLVPAVADVSPVSGRAERRTVAKSGGADAGKVVGGAVAGAVLGRVIGGGTKGTVIGAAGGAATGAVLAKGSTKYESCLAAGAPVRVRLTQALALR